MKFPAHWTRVQNADGNIAARGWSDTSLAEATSNAESRLQRILAALSNTGTFDLDRYSYVIDNVICEEVIDRVTDSGDELAVVSRNAYGSLILNAKRLMFVDIDFPKPTGMGCLLALLGKKKPALPSPEEIVLNDVRLWQANHPDFSLRVYRTLNGIRVIVVNVSFDQIDTSVIAMMQELNGDPLYIKLCRSQSCFRARLSPKPWRVGMSSAPKRFPFDKADDKTKFDEWYGQYLSKAKKYKVCNFLETVGNAETLPQHLKLIDLHDNLCCATDERPLA